MIVEMSAENLENKEILTEGYHSVEEMPTCELDAKKLLEVKGSEAELGISSVIYVPHEELEKYRAKSEEISVHSIEARAAVHETIHQEAYKQNYTLKFRNPAKTMGQPNNLGMPLRKPYNSSDNVIDISTVDGSPVYTGKAI